MKAIATNAGFADFQACYRTPLPIAAPLEAPFADLDDDDLSIVDPSPRDSKPTSPDTHLDDIPRCTTVVRSSADGPVYRLIPERREYGVECDRNPIPASLIRKIERELRDDTCDPRIVFQACRNMPRGSREFETAYTSARVSAYVSQPRRSTTTTAPVVSSEFSSLPTWQWNAENSSASPNHHPLAVANLGDLMNHLGLLVITLLAAQTWAAWKIGGFTTGYLEGDHSLHFAASLLLMLSLNAFVWFRRRGSLFDQFIGPGVVLFVLAVVPGLVLHVLGTLRTLG